ncbi:unnamed protein product [Arabidopsis halleri]
MLSGVWILVRFSPAFALLSVPGRLVSTIESVWVCFLAKKKFRFVCLDRWTSKLTSLSSP